MQTFRRPTVILYVYVMFSLFIGNIAQAEVASASGGGITVNAGPVLPSFADTVEKVMPAVVNISTSYKASSKKNVLSLRKMLEEQFELQRDPFWMQEPVQQTVSLGSGFIIDPKGYIVTNYHVVDGAEEIKVTLSRNARKAYEAKVIGKDVKTDLAVLKIEAQEDLPYLKFGDSDKARVGDWVIAIGNPFGLGGTVTTGIISAKARDILTQHLDDFIQTDAAINFGNSGGPMLNTAGEVIGVNSVIVSPSGGNIGIGFAIPTNVTRGVVKQLKEKGEVVRGWLGVTIQNVDQNIAESFGLKGEARGALVSSVLKGTPAEKAGILVGDIITKFNGKEIVSMHKLPRVVGETPLYTKVPLELWRSGKFKTIEVVVEKLNEAAEETEKGAANGRSTIGISVHALTPEVRRLNNIGKDDSGVLVTQVERDSAAASAGVRPGDVVKSVNNQAINTPKEFEKALQAAKKSNKNAVAFLLLRDATTFFVTIELKK